MIIHKVIVKKNFKTWFSSLVDINMENISVITDEGFLIKSSLLLKMTLFVYFAIL